MEYDKQRLFVCSKTTDEKYGNYSTVFQLITTYPLRVWPNNLIQSVWRKLHWAIMMCNIKIGRSQRPWHNNSMGCLEVTDTHNILLTYFAHKQLDLLWKKTMWVLQRSLFFDIVSSKFNVASTFLQLRDFSTEMNCFHAFKILVYCLCNIFIRFKLSCCQKTFSFGNRW